MADEPPEKSEIEVGPDDEILEGAPEEEVVEAAATKVADRAIRILSARFAGPLPPPGALAAYEDLSPGLANRIMEMAEREQTHRHQLENTAFATETLLGKRGQIFALGICLAGFVVVIILALNGEGGAAAIIGSLDLVGLVAAFLVRPRSPYSQGPPESEAE
jgi:uncharacterized membrane protein